MSHRSIFILWATAFVVIILVVLLLVPAPSASTELVENLVMRLEGALGPLLAATAHTLFTDRQDAKVSS